MSAPETPPITPSEALEHLRDFPAFADAGISMRAIALDQNGEYRAYLMVLSKNAQAALAQIAEESRASALDQTPVAYAPAVLIAPGHVMHVSSGEAASLGKVVEQVAGDDSAPYSDLPPRTVVKLLAFRFTAADGQQVIFFRFADTLSQLKESKFLALARAGNVYHKLEPADVMLLRRTYDVTYIDGTAFFTHKPTFERAFGFFEQLRAASGETFEAVTAELRIRGMEQMKAACMKQPQMMAKMASIRRSMNSDPGYAAAMTMERLVAFVRERDYIDVEIATEDGEEVLVYKDDVVHRFQILKLLDDDYLHSVLTERDYESGSKVQP
ncbi:DUF4868 domain-containing protein [Plantibacter sp. VKM Ac-2885]|uniref:Kiwa anti-phage protein KwaB-like domain-containing protein n=1 Tax=Plantibacter sp. VKM Ac-2885 TaxID=2783828 RepID=UPI00188A012A|nr:DUF4868 domain-containing protein [Plantibacter sp. VKM Ac-2885]